MRKRLYQALPDNSDLIDNVISASEEKKIKRLYAENNVNEQSVSVTDAAVRNASLAEMVALTEIQLDMLYAFFDHYEKEITKIALTNYTGWHYSTATAAKSFDCYMDIGNIAWEMGVSVACDSATSSTQFFLNSFTYR